MNYRIAEIDDNQDVLLTLGFALEQAEFVFAVRVAQAGFSRRSIHYIHPTPLCSTSCYPTRMVIR
jgi:hypothetical protein